MGSLYGVAVFLTVLTLACCAEGQTHQRYNFPNPQNKSTECGRDRKSFVCDPDRLLGADQANQLDNLIEEVKRDTACPCSGFICDKKKGYHIAVALVKEIAWEGKQDINDMSDAQMAEMIDKKMHEAKLFAYTLLTKWNIGRCQEDVIIFYSLSDDVLYTMTGGVARATLKDVVVGEISMKHRNMFDGENTFEGLKRIIEDYKRVFNGQYAYKPMKETRHRPRSAAYTSASARLTSGHWLPVTAVLAMLYKYLH